jgi:hypothetical protein
MSLLQLHLVEAESAPTVVVEVIHHLRRIPRLLQHQEAEVVVVVKVAAHVRADIDVELF